MNKYPATGSKRGSLLVNPGGPGEPGLGFAAQIAALNLAPDYDIVGFDPRGVGASGQLTCLAGAARTSFDRAPQAPATDEGRRQWRRAAAGLARACAAKYPTLLPHLGTENTAGDLEVLRSVLGDRRLTYLGGSYGTLIGQYYAERYPARVGRLYLDSVMNPALSLPQLIEDNAASSQQTFDRFLDWCHGRHTCTSLGPSPTGAQQRLKQMVTRLDTGPAPVKAGSKRPVTGSDLRTAIAAGIGTAQQWPDLARTLSNAAQGDFNAVRELADDRDSDTHVAVACTFATKEDRSHQALDKAVARATHRSWLFGPIDSFRPCAYWPDTSSVTAHKITTRTGGSVLLANNAFDPETPYRWATAAAAGIKGAILVRNEAAGHGFLPMGPCTRNVVTAYFHRTVTPPPGTVCKDTGLPR
ncbi:alpha/beta hydrolase [Streptomyces sp. H62]